MLMRIRGPLGEEVPGVHIVCAQYRNAASDEHASQGGRDRHKAITYCERSLR